jgi:hypothetical protein
VRRRALGHFQSLRTDQRTQRSRDIHIGSAPLKLFLSLEHPATSQHRQNGSPSRSLVSTEPPRLLDRLSRHRNASIEDMVDIALFDRRETPFHVQTHYNDSLLTFSQLPLLQVRIPRSIESFCARKYALQKYTPWTLKITKSAQLRHHDHHPISRDSFWLLHTFDKY